MKGYGIIEIGKGGWLEKDVPQIGALDALLRPIAVAPCSSDVHILHGSLGPMSNRIVGHEAIGEIVDVGTNIKKFKKGDRVVIPCVTPDWEMTSVQGKYSSHDTGLMGSIKFVGQKDGVFAEYFTVNNADANLAFLPDDISYESALMAVDMMSTGFHGVELADIGFGDTVAIIGIGPVGLMAVAGARLGGAGKIIGVGTRPDCVKLALEYGANEIVSYKKGDIVEQILDIADGEVDSVIIAGGTKDTVAQAMKMVKNGGIISNIAMYDINDTISFPASDWGMGMSNKQLKCGFCPGGGLRMEKMLAMIQSKAIDPSKMVSHKFHGFEQIEDAFVLMGDKTPDVIKPVVVI